MDRWMDGWIHIDYPHVCERKRELAVLGHRWHTSASCLQASQPPKIWQPIISETEHSLKQQPWQSDHEENPPSSNSSLLTSWVFMRVCIMRVKTPDIAKVSVSLPIMPPDNDIAALWLTISFQRHSGSESARKVNDCLLMWIVNSSPLSVYKTNVIIHNVTMTLTHTHSLAVSVITQQLQRAIQKHMKIIVQVGALSKWLSSF